jgi:arylsulfatase A-like enzyme/dienelactone hydrolase
MAYGWMLVVTILVSFLELGRQAHAKPNIIFIVADDLGFGDVGFHGCRDIATPHLDALAASSVRFSDGYVTAPICGPSRAALLSGVYHERLSWAGNPAPITEPDRQQKGLPVEVPTLADHLRTLGYATGLVGKWHLGEEERFHPLRRGFDEFFGFLGGAHDYFHERDEHYGWLLRGSQPVKLEGYLTDAFGQEASRFIERHRSQPFFLCLTFNAVHAPAAASAEMLRQLTAIADPQRRVYAAMTMRMDAAIGRVLSTLREHHLDQDTLVAFLSDNGGPVKHGPGAIGASNSPLRGEKIELLEGGVRVPFLLRWPARMAGGLVCSTPVISLDLYATALHAAEADAGLLAKAEGINLLPALTGECTQAAARALYWRSPPQRAIRKGDWKLVMWTTPALKKPLSGLELYRVASDPGEAENVVDQHPEKVEELVALWNAWNQKNFQRGNRFIPANAKQPPNATAASGSALALPSTVSQRWSGLEPTRLVTYKQLPERTLALHIFQPTAWKPTDRRPCLLAIHGGGWGGGEPRRAYPYAYDFAARGMVGISLQYRLTNPKTYPGTSIHDCIRDARSAVRYVRAHAADLGIDPQRIVVFGMSAGGHLALTTALLDTLNEPGDDLRISARPDALLLTFPVVDTTATGLKPPGKELTDADREAISPVHQLRPKMPPTIIFNGEADTLTPLDRAVALQQRMVEMGSTCEIVAWPGGKHGHTNVDAAAYEQLLQRGWDFLKKHGFQP